MAIMISIEAMNKYGFFDGSICGHDEDDLYYRLWNRCNNMVKSWLLNIALKKIYTPFSISRMLLIFGKIYP